MASPSMPPRKKNRLMHFLRSRLPWRGKKTPPSVLRRMNIHPTSPKAQLIMEWEMAHELEHEIPYHPQTKGARDPVVEWAKERHMKAMAAARRLLTPTQFSFAYHVINQLPIPSALKKDLKKEMKN